VVPHFHHQQHILHLFPGVGHDRHGHFQRCGHRFFGKPNQFFGGLSNTTQGIAINPITHSAALADANATSQQINVLNQLDQTVSSISFQTGCTFFTVSCTTSGEIPGTARVAWQPYTNSIVSYNPGTPSVAVNQVSISDPITRARYALINMPTGTVDRSTSRSRMALRIRSHCGEASR